MDNDNDPDADPEPLVTFPDDSRASSEVGSPQPNNAIEGLTFEQKTMNNFTKTKVRTVIFILRNMD